MFGPGLSRSGSGFLVTSAALTGSSGRRVHGRRMSEGVRVEVEESLTVDGVPT